MAYTLDHVFVAVEPGAPQMEQLVARGFEEGPRREHRGQGTASCGVFFENAYLELIWLEDPALAESEPVRSTYLGRRVGLDPAASPFGLGVRPTVAGEPPPFATWDYRPPYLPGDGALPIGLNSRCLEEPLLFALPWKTGPGYAAPRHPNGTRAITRVSVWLLEELPLSPELKSVRDLGAIHVRFGEHRLAEVELDGGGAGEKLDLRPATPLILRW